jgi:excisionase family DNA binding protein
VDGIDLEVDPAGRSNGAPHPGSDSGSDLGTDPGLDLRTDPGSGQAPAEGFTIAEAATLLGVHVNTIRRRIRRGRLAATLAPGPAGPEYRLAGAVLEALRRELALEGRAPQLRPGPTAGPATRTDSGSDPRIDPGSDLAAGRIDPVPDPGSAPGSDPRPDSAADQDGPARVGASASTSDTTLAAALGAAQRAEVGRLEEVIVLLKDELEVRRREQAEERDAHRREVEQLHTLLAQAHQLALPRPQPIVDAPQGPAAPGPPDGDGAGAPAVTEAAEGWWQRVLAWLRA